MNRSFQQIPYAFGNWPLDTGWFSTFGKCTLPKFKMEPEINGYQRVSIENLPVPGTDFHVPTSNFRIKAWKPNIIYPTHIRLAYSMDVCGAASTSSEIRGSFCKRWYIITPFGQYIILNPYTRHILDSGFPSSPGTRILPANSSLFFGEAFIGIFRWLGCSLPTGPHMNGVFFGVSNGHPLGDQLIGRNLWHMLFMSWEDLWKSSLSTGQGNISTSWCIFHGSGGCLFIHGSSIERIAGYNWRHFDTPRYGQGKKAAPLEQNTLACLEDRISISLWWWHSTVWRILMAIL